MGPPPPLPRRPRMNVGTLRLSLTNRYKTVTRAEVDWSGTEAGEELPYFPGIFNHACAC